MNSQAWLLVSVLGLCCLGPGAVPAREAEGNGPVWLTDYEQARKAAQASGKPVFVVLRCEH